MKASAARNYVLITSRASTHEEIKRALEQRPGGRQLAWMSQAELAVSWAEGLAPDVLLVDDELNGASPITLIQALAQRLPATILIFLVGAGQNALNDARRAMLVGAHGFISKPLGSDFLSALEEILSRGHSLTSRPDARSEASGRVIAFVGPKGGTGRTTLAVNTAVGLQMTSGEGTAIVDADYASPAIDVFLNLHAQHSILDLLARSSGIDEELINTIMARHVSGVQVLLAPPPKDLSQPITLPKVHEILVLLKHMFSWVIVDLGLPMDETTFAFLDGADRIVISVLPELVGLRNARLMLDQLRARGHAADKVWLALNRATLAGGVARRDIEQWLQVPVRHMIPDDQPLVTHSINCGVPVMMNSRRSAVMRSYQEFVQLLLNDLAAQSTSSVSPDAGTQTTRGTKAEGLLKSFRPSLHSG